MDTDPKLKDEGGHAFAASNGSPKEMAYIFPQAYRVNHSKEWKALEKIQKNEIKKAKTNNGKIDLYTESHFEYPGESKRPKTITQIIITSDKIRHEKHFNNSNSPSVPILLKQDDKSKKLEEKQKKSK